MEWEGNGICHGDSGKPDPSEHTCGSAQPSVLEKLGIWVETGAPAAINTSRGQLRSIKVKHRQAKNDWAQADAIEVSGMPIARIQRTFV